MNYVGIDVSKATFVVAYSSAKGSETKTFKNTIKGVHKFIQTITPEDTHCVMELLVTTVCCLFTCYPKLVLQSVWKILSR